MKSGNYLVIQADTYIHRDSHYMLSYILGKDIFHNSDSMRARCVDIGTKSLTYNKQLSNEIEELICDLDGDYDFRIPNFSSRIIVGWEREGWKEVRTNNYNQLKFAVKTTTDTDKNALLGIGIYFGNNKLTKEQINYIGMRAIEFFKLDEDLIFQTEAKVASYSFVEVKQTQTVHSFKDC